MLGYYDEATAEAAGTQHQSVLAEQQQRLGLKLDQMRALQVAGTRT